MWLRRRDGLRGADYPVTRARNGRRGGCGSGITESTAHAAALCTTGGIRYVCGPPIERAEARIGIPGSRPWERGSVTIEYPGWRRVDGGRQEDALMRGMVNWMGRYGASMHTEQGRYTKSTQRLCRTDISRSIGYILVTALCAVWMMASVCNSGFCHRW